jgi:hypothetical protein
MAGLDPAIHAPWLPQTLKALRRLNGLDGRVKPGHDGSV